MSTNLFLAFSSESSVPLHIVARSCELAREAYTDWVLSHSVAWSHEALVIREARADWVDAQPQLASAVHEASKAALPSILYWIGHREGWLPELPQATPRRAIAPVEPIVQAYRLTVENIDELFVFADNPTQALQIFFDWREEWGKPVDAKFALVPCSRWQFLGEQTALREQMDIGHVGIAGWSEQTGWGIFQFDHAATRRA